MVKSVSGKRILVTGSGAGLGRDLALYLAGKGASLVLWDLDTQGNEETARLVRETGAEAEAMTVNVASAEAYAEAARKTGEVWGVINNAGIVNGQTFLESDPQRNELTFKVNVFAHFYAARHFLPAMIRADDGVFVSVASVASYFGSPGMVDYASSKAACRVFIETLAQEVFMQAPNVHLACACPSAMDTALFQGFKAKAIPGNATLQTADVAKYIVDDLMERGQATAIWPSLAKVTATLKGMWPERMWRTFVWPDLRPLMAEHNMDQADKIFSSMDPASKL